MRNKAYSNQVTRTAETAPVGEDDGVVGHQLQAACVVLDRFLHLIRSKRLVTFRLRLYTTD